MDYLLVQLLNGLSFSLLLFFAAAGLSISFGLLNLTNLAHGGFYMLGGYVALTVMAVTKNFWLALIAAPILLAALGAVMELGFLRRLYRRDHLDQVLLTLGFAYLIWDVANWIWGGDPYLLTPPAGLDSMFQIFDINYPVYRVALLGAGLALAGVLLWVESGTRIGAIIRAGVSDPDMLRAMGVNVSLVFTLTFCFSAALAGLGGVVGGPIIGLYRDVDFEVLMLATVVVVVGGLGSLRGTLASCLLIGILDSFGKIYFPDFSLVSVFIVMVVVLLVRPTGLFGVQRSHVVGH
ncbi:MAG: branched-chain amino acid ABC transporter permease [Noviherbaspirillum sp.]